MDRHSRCCGGAGSAGSGPGVCVILPTFHRAGKALTPTPVRLTPSGRLRPGAALRGFRLRPKKDRPAQGRRSRPGAGRRLLYTPHSRRRWTEVQEPDIPHPLRTSPPPKSSAGGSPPSVTRRRRPSSRRLAQRRLPGKLSRGFYRSLVQ